MMTKSQCEQESNTHSERIHTSTSLNQTGSRTRGSWSMAADNSVLFNLLSLKRFAAPVELCSAKSVTSIWPDSQLAHVYVCAIMLPYSCWSPKGPKTDAIALKTCHKILATVRHSGYWVETLFMTGNERESQCTNWFLHLFLLLPFSFQGFHGVWTPHKMHIQIWYNISYKFSQPSLITDLVFLSLQLFSAVSFLLNLAMFESKSVWLTLSQGGVPFPYIQSTFTPTEL